MHWYVYVEDFNSKQIKQYDIFSHNGFVTDVKKAYKQYKEDFDTFSEKVKRILQYYFWAQCEWEIILSNWPPSDSFQKEKIDVYDQVILNWDVFIKYVWDNGKAIK